MDAIDETDPKVADLIRDEQRRQADTIRLIASENYASQAILEATGSVLTNKYSEGYPGRRYYEGQEVTDKIERLARQRAEQLYGADHANVQPYSGSPANQAAYQALMDVGDTLFGMGLPYGGHLSHGWKVNYTGTLYDAHHYAVDRETHRLDFDDIAEQAGEVDPDVIVCGASAYPREIPFERFGEIADDVGAYLVADIAHISGLVAADKHPDPVPHADVVTTTTHKTLRGPRSGLILCTEEHADAIDRAIFPTLQGGPHMHAVAAAAVGFKEALSPDFKEYAAQIIENSRALADALSDHGFDVITGGSDNHLVLIDVTTRDIGGKKASSALAEAGIVCNANSIPYDDRKPMDPSGIRLGTPSVTTRGMQTDEMRTIADWIDRVVDAPDDQESLTAIRQEVEAFCESFSVPHRIDDPR
jgi:glycine hydroxymethyltransferase